MPGGELATFILLPIGLGLFGFIEPCAIGSTLLFIKTTEGTAAATKIGQVLAFTLSRAVFTGVLGALAVLSGSVFLGLQKAVWLVLGGLYAVIGVLSALRVRDQTGQGQVIDLSLLESQAAYLTVLAGDYFATGQPPRPIGNTHPGIVPYQVFKTADKDVIIAVGSDRQWAQLCEVLVLGWKVRDDPRFATNPDRLANRPVLIDLLQARLSALPSAEVLSRLQAAEIPCGPINTVPDSLADPHYVARGNIIEQQHPAAGPIRSIANPVRLSETPAAYRLPPPRLGEHTDAILRELGYSAGELEVLHRAGDV